MSARLFKRSPRLVPEIPADEIEVSGPSAQVMAPTTSLVTILIPAGATIIGIAIPVLIALSGESSTLALTSFLASGLMMAGSYLATYLSYSGQKEKFKRESELRQIRYLNYLVQVRTDLLNKQSQSWQAMQRIDPEPAELVRWAINTENRLWERSLNDLDFLFLRLGVGERLSSIKLKLPKIDPANERDPLVEEALKLSRLTTIHQAPIQLPLRTSGVAGFYGTRSTSISLVRSMILQLAGLHSPNELKLAVVYPDNEDPEWNWTRWLPHVWSEDRTRRYISKNRDKAHALFTYLYDIFISRKRSIETEHSTMQNILPKLSFVIILATPELVEHEPLMPLLLNEGLSLGIMTVFISDFREHLPRECQVLIKAEGANCILSYPRENTNISFTPDLVDSNQGDHFARALAPLRLQEYSKSSKIPQLVTLMDVLGASSVEDLNIRDRWIKSQPSKSLAAPIGRRAGGEIISLDLHEKSHGPHGLGAGTSGWGKSELLQSLIASLAANYHPHEVAFVLVDFKAGGMVNIFNGLPHLVGVVMSGQEALVPRALRSLKAEAVRRNRILATISPANPNINVYLEKYRRGEISEPMPHLVIIVDEFGELISAMPDFISSLVSVARIGRSAGMHLILATQKPAGIVNEQIWSNTRFHFCLRVENAQDSQDILHRPDASFLTRKGEAYLQVGNDEILERFQTAWGGAPYNVPRLEAANQQQIFKVNLDGSKEVLGSPRTSDNVDMEFTQLEAVVRHISFIAQTSNIPPVNGPWLQPLPYQLDLDSIRPDRGFDGSEWRSIQHWMTPVVGLLDLPEDQRQDPFEVNLGQEGHIGIYGAPGVGKTTFLSTIILSLALDYSPDDIQIYLADFGARLLSIFSEMPHIGGIVLADESERIERLLQMLIRTMETRKTLFSTNQVGNLIAYRSTTQKIEPAILFAIDNLPGLLKTFPHLEDEIIQIAQEGGGLGIHLAFTANNTTQVRSRIINNVNLSVALTLTDRGEYSVIVGPTHGLEPENTPGRGLNKGKPPYEFQTALPMKGENELDRSRNLRQLIEQLKQVWQGSLPPEIPVRPKLLELDKILSKQRNLAHEDKLGFKAYIGMEIKDLLPFAVDLNTGGNFIITGPVQSGKTTLLQTWLLSLADCYNPKDLQMCLVDYRQDNLFSLSSLPHVEITAGYIYSDEKLEMILGHLDKILAERRESARQHLSQLRQASPTSQPFFSPSYIIAIDDFEVFVKRSQEGIRHHLEEILHRNRNLGVYVIVADSYSNFSTSWEGITKTLREAPTGFILGTNDSSQLSILNIRLPLEESGKKILVGEGYFAHRGMEKNIKVATPWEGEHQLPDLVQRIKDTRGIV